MKNIKKIVMTIEWIKSRMWGYNPHLTAEIVYDDHTREWFKTRCSGCGYDKESTVLADVFNKFLTYKLSEKKIINRIKKSNRAYGISLMNETRKKAYYGSGIGAECYYHISDLIGGKLEKIASTDKIDVYVFYNTKKGK